MPAPVLQVKRGALSNLPGLKAGEPAFTTDSFDFYVGIDSTTNNNKFVGSHRYWTKETSTTGSGVRFVERTDGGSNYIELKAPDTAFGSNVTYVLPSTQGTNGTVLTNDGSGNLTWGSGSNNATFSGITTFSDTTDSTSKDTGAVIIEGGVGIEKSINIGGNIYVSGISTFNGLTITNNNLDVQAHAEIQELSVLGIASVSSSLMVDGDIFADAGLRVLGITTISDTSDSTTPQNGAFRVNGGAGIQKSLHVGGDLHVDGNVSVGGTTVTLKGEDVYIQNKDIILGFTTAISPNEDTANHAGVAIASTVGTPLASFAASGINTLPDTYKQLMWFQNGTLGFSTDAFAFNYGLAVGTTTMANGVRLAVGSGITMSDDSISATNFYGTLSGSISGNAASADQVKTVTASNTNATYHLTFVDANNGSATNENVYTDDGIYYNPGTNTFTTQHALFTGNVEVQGTLTGTATTATRATTVDTTGTSTNADYYVTFVDTLAGETGETLRVGAGLSVNPSTGAVRTKGILSVGDPGALTSYIKAGGGSNALYMYGNGDVSFQAKAIVNQIRSSSNASTLITLSDLDATFARNVKVTGITTTATLSLNGTAGIAITGISTSLTENSNSYLPTQAAVKSYVDAVDLTIDTAAGTNGSGTGSVSTSQTLTFNGTTDEVDVTVSGQSVTYGLPSSVSVTTDLTTPTVNVSNVKANDGTSSITISDSTGNVGIASNLTVSGNLYVQGTTTEVNTDSLKVEDPLIDLGLIDNGSGQLVPPTSDLNYDIGVLLNWYSDSAKKAAVYWDDSLGRVGIASDVSESNNVLTASAYADVEIGSLWVTDCAGTSQVISCTGAERFLENITVDAGTF